MLPLNVRDQVFFGDFCQGYLFRNKAEHQKYCGRYAQQIPSHWLL